MKKIIGKAKLRDTLLLYYIPVCLRRNAQYIVSREYIEGSYRFNKILEEIKSYDATVLALQVSIIYKDTLKG